MTRISNYYLFFLPLLLFLGGSQSFFHPDIDPNTLSGKLIINLHHGLWKLWQEKAIYQDLTLDFNCQQGKCQGKVGGYAPKFNREVDHFGVIEEATLDQSLKLQVKMKIKMHPWQADLKDANYTIQLLPNKKKLIGNYRGEFNDKKLSGEVDGNISSPWPRQVTNHQPIQPQEHPRLIFRADQVPDLRRKAQTDYGKAILARLRQILNGKVYYDGYVPNGGYHAASHCFLALIDDNSAAAAKAWQLVKKSLDNPGNRLLEQSPIVAGVALAYDMCYPYWNQAQRKEITIWLTQKIIKLVNGGSSKDNWNGNSWSNWSARARGAAGLAALAILDEPADFFPQNKFISKPEDLWLFLQTAKRNVERYLTIAIGDRGFGSEGDLYTTEPWLLTIVPFLQAYRHVLGEDLITDSAASWLLPHYVTRTIANGDQLNLPTYGRHRHSAVGSLLAIGLGIVPDDLLPGVLWYFQRYLGIKSDHPSLGISEYRPHEAIFALVGYPENLSGKNPADIWGKVIADQKKGFYIFRNQWQDEQDFVATIYSKREFLRASWSFPEAASFRIFGLGEEWAVAGAGDGKRKSENVVILDQENQVNQGNQVNKVRKVTSQEVFWQTFDNGSGVVSLGNNNWLRSFAVDYSGVSGSPGLFVVVDKFREQNQQKTWLMHTKGKVTIADNSFTIQGDHNTTMQGTFVLPSSVEISFEPGSQGGKIMATTEGDEFFVVMTVQEQTPPPVEILGNGLNTFVKVGGQTITFREDQIILVRNN